MLRRYRFELILILLIICAVVATRFPLLIIYPAFAFCCFYQLSLK